MNNKVLRNLRLAVCSPFRRSKICYIGNNGKTVKILANGPSLKKCLHNLIDSDSTLVLNNFFLHDSFMIIKPRYYAIFDPVYFEDSISKPPYDHIYEIIGKIDWEITFIIPYKYYTNFRNKVFNPKVSIKTIYRFPGIHRFVSKNLDYFLYKKGISAPTSQNVLIPSIYAMINEGYDTIYLYGAEHSWTTQLVVNDSNQVCLSDNHFYDEKPVLDPWLKANGIPYKMHEILNDLKITFYTYHELSEYASKISNVNIINKTENSFIDAFIKE